jgi:hypothetical protein
MKNRDIRWQYRFENFSKASLLLFEIHNYKIDDTTDIILEGFI